MTEEIKIENLTDILDKIPLGKISDFMIDLEEWLIFRHNMKPYVEAGVVAMRPYLIWKDDGITGLSEVRIINEIPPESA